MWTKALEIARHINNPIAATSFAVVVAAFLFWLALRSKKKSGVFWSFFVASMVVFLLGLAPLFASTYLKSRGVYRVIIEVMGPDKQRVTNATVSSLPAAQISKADGSWEIVVPPQIRPADGELKLFAAIPEAFLSGSTKLTLADDYFPITTIQLEPMPSAIVRGVVLDERGRPVSGASVAIEGYGEIRKTNEMGNFEIPSRYAQGQQVTLRATKDGLSASKIGPAGDGFELSLRR